MNKHIVAVALLTEAELRSLGETFDRAWPVGDAGDFDMLLQAIDEAERSLEEHSERSE